MKKEILSFAFILLCVFCLTGCGEKKDTVSTKVENKVEEPKQEEKKEVYTFENLKEDLTNLDKNIQINNKAASMLGAEEGYGYIMTGCKIEVYKFDKSSTQYEQAEKEQKLSMSSMNMTFDASVKDGYAYMIVEGKCDEAISYIEKLN